MKKKRKIMVKSTELTSPYGFFFFCRRVVRIYFRKKYRTALNTISFFLSLSLSFSPSVSLSLISLSIHTCVCVCIVCVSLSHSISLSLPLIDPSVCSVAQTRVSFEISCARDLRKCEWKYHIIGRKHKN